MIKIYFCKIKKGLTDHQLEKHSQTLPLEIRERIAAYSDPAERQMRTISKLMLAQLISDFGLSHLLTDIKYTPSNKPYIAETFDFSIAHSVDMVVCAAATDCELGVDIEVIKPLDIIEYEDYLTMHEWAYINGAEEPKEAFYEIWTKKEAALKASGIGLDTDLNKVDVSDQKVTLLGKDYHIQPIKVSVHTIAHIATSLPNPKIEIKEYRLDS
jgi:4'-phosphopantetheinyl transferase